MAWRTGARAEVITLAAALVGGRAGGLSPRSAPWPLAHPRGRAYRGENSGCAAGQQREFAKSRFCEDGLDATAAGWEGEAHFHAAEDEVGAHSLEHVVGPSSLLQFPGQLGQSVLAVTQGCRVGHGSCSSNALASYGPGDLRCLVEISSEPIALREAAAPEIE